MSKRIPVIYTVERNEEGYDSGNDREYYSTVIDTYWATRMDAERRAAELVATEGEDDDWTVGEYRLFQDYEQFENRFVVVEEQTDED